MIKIPKSTVLEVLELNPAFLIGKEIFLKDSDKDSVKIRDVNLKCSHIQIEGTDMSIKWVNADELEDEILFDRFNSDKPMITIGTIYNLFKIVTGPPPL